MSYELRMGSIEEFIEQVLDEDMLKTPDLEKGQLATVLRNWKKAVSILSATLVA